MKKKCRHELEDRFDGGVYLYSICPKCKVGGVSLRKQIVHNMTIMGVKFDRTLEWEKRHRMTVEEWVKLYIGF